MSLLDFILLQIIVSFATWFSDPLRRDLNNHPAYFMMLIIVCLTVWLSSIAATKDREYYEDFD